METYYILNGKDKNGKKFRLESKNGYYLSCHNVWRGNLWRVENGKKTRIKTWFN